MRIAIDVMGGDYAPDAVLAGSLAAVGLLAQDDRLVLVGQEDVILDALENSGSQGDPRIEIHPASQVIAMDESPVVALRSKPDSSIVRMAELGRARAGDQQCDVIISAGNTGACVAAAQMAMRRLPGVNRPGIAVTMPTFVGPVVLCDVGANPEPKPHHLYQYGQMANIYASKVVGIENPRVALLSIGDEESKGNALVKEAAKLIRADKSINYVGYVEGRDLFVNRADVVVSEGFTGNVVIKLAEGLAAGIFKTIAQEMYQIDPSLAPKFEQIVKRIYKRHDYHEYGGAPLLGVNGICIICHGASEARTFTAAIKMAMAYARFEVNQGIIEAVGRLVPVQEGAA